MLRPTFASKLSLPILYLVLGLERRKKGKIDLVLEGTEILVSRARVRLQLSRCRFAVSIGTLALILEQRCYIRARCISKPRSIVTLVASIIATSYSSECDSTFQRNDGLDSSPINDSSFSSIFFYLESE